MPENTQNKVSKCRKRCKSISTCRTTCTPVFWHGKCEHCMAKGSIDLVSICPDARCPWCGTVWTTRCSAPFSSATAAVRRRRCPWHLYHIHINGITVCVCVCERERELELLWASRMCACVRASARARACVYMCVLEIARVRACVYVCAYVMMTLYVYVCVCECVCVRCFGKTDWLL